MLTRLCLTALLALPSAAQITETYSIVFLRPAPDRKALPKEEGDRLQAAHMANIHSMAERGVLVAAGPFDDEPRAFSGIFIMRTASPGEALRIASADPTVVARRNTVDAIAWTGPKGVGEEHKRLHAADPKTPENMGVHPFVLLRETPPPAGLARLRTDRKLAAAGAVSGNSEFRCLLILQRIPDDEARRLVDPSWKPEFHRWWSSAHVLPEWPARFRAFLRYAGNMHSQTAAMLTVSLNLTQPPIAVCLRNEVPAGVPLWSGPIPAGCRFWQEAATRVFATSAPDHERCAVGQYTHGLEMSAGAAADLQEALKVFADLTYVRPEDIAAIPVLEEKSRYVIYGPLGSVPAEPDVVLLFVRADQTLILSEASQQLEGGLPPAMGRPACAIVPQARNSGRSALSLGCCGARAYLDVLTADMALYAVPGASIDAFAERIAALAQANTVLTRFHRIRRRDIEAGEAPTVRQSLAAMQNS